MKAIHICAIIVASFTFGTLIGNGLIAGALCGAILGWFVVHNC